MKISHALKCVVWLKLQGVATAVCHIPSTKHYVIPKTSVPPVIDGSLNDDVWENAPWTDEFTGLLDSFSGLVPSLNMRTRAKMLWDDQNIYVGAQMTDPILFANVSNPLDLELYDNTFEIFIDFDRTNHHYKRIQMNPLGNHRTLEYPRPPDDGGLPSGWDASSKITYGVFNSTPINVIHDALSLIDSVTETNSQWSVEWAIPISLLRKARKRSDTANSAMPSFANFQFMRAGWPPASIPHPQEDPGGLNKRELLSLLEPINEGPFQHVWSVLHDNTTNTVDNPEYWGTIEFSDSVKVDPDHRLKSDPQKTARHVLMEVYHAQKAYFTSHGHYTASLRELRSKRHRLFGCGKIPRITLSNDRLRYTASVRSGEKIGKVREDRLLWFTMR
ncbi:CBD9-like protein [Basidiobolus meristosporus CBS 931.73]|uniref:CBD9-like protein n=1 Tax=Basidiobolus meristosporus CBS 931.73 TaxID=1314790 RepID=A0A1Y1YHT0_9FUNG|nr:CBD9-like protein [Basidiobolus meristosporus CBS 931.73]|eukprot:ORX97591.1 CBD9-like protein [Basidiobolus meristosporus CBS 931.73]